MDFEKNVPTWNATGTEPPESLKTSGFTAGYRPPAAFFNWFWSGVSACLAEIRAKLKSHAENTSNPHGVTKAQVGLNLVDNTADADKSVKYATSSGSASKVTNNVAIKFNGGSTEGTNLFTYNGSAAKTVNITPDGIGAAKKDLSNVDSSAFKSAASAAGIGGGTPIVDATSTDGVAYTATVDGVATLTNGLTITIIPSMTSTSTAITLNVNSLGAKAVRLPLSFNNAGMTTPKLEGYYVASRPITLQFDAGYSTEGIWKVLGKQKTSASDLYGTVPIESGGTGATNAADARTNLGITAENIGASPSEHTQSASTITSGMFPAWVKANTASEEALTTAQLRNIYAGTTDLTAGSSALATGEVYLVYE